MYIRSSLATIPVLERHVFDLSNTQMIQYVKMQFVTRLCILF